MSRPMPLPGEPIPPDTPPTPPPHPPQPPHPPPAQVHRGTPKVHAHVIVGNDAYGDDATLAVAPGAEGNPIGQISAAIAESFEKQPPSQPTFANVPYGTHERQVLDFYQVPATELLVVCDDVNLPLGTLRARARGTPGGHNGLRDIQNHLGTTEYSRLRVGVGAPDGSDMVDHVLGRFSRGEAAVMDESVRLAAEAVGVWIHQGIERVMNQYNAREKGDKEEGKP